jgi:hypothetical protein
VLEYLLELLENSANTPWLAAGAMIADCLLACAIMYYEEANLKPND